MNWYTAFASLFIASKCYMLLSHCALKQGLGWISYAKWTFILNVCFVYYIKKIMCARKRVWVCLYNVKKSNQEITRTNYARETIESTAECNDWTYGCCFLLLMLFLIRTGCSGFILEISIFVTLWRLWDEIRNHF